MFWHFLVSLHIWNICRCGTHIPRVKQYHLYLGLGGFLDLLSMGVLPSILLDGRDNWVPGISALYLNWLILSGKPLKFLLVYFHTTLRRKVLLFCLQMENRFAQSEMIAQGYIASQWSASSLETTSSSWSPALATLSWIHLEKDPLFESPEVVFFPLVPTFVACCPCMADCLLSTETCGQHKGPIAIALKCLPFLTDFGQLLSVASRLGGKESH